MLYVSTTFNSEEGYAWHVNDKPIRLHNSKTILELYADGNELEYIKELGVNIPLIKGVRSVTWYGDMAQFIAVNFGIVEA